MKRNITLPILRSLLLELREVRARDPPNCPPHKFAYSCISPPYIDSLEGCALCFPLRALSRQYFKVGLNERKVGFR